MIKEFMGTFLSVAITCGGFAGIASYCETIDKTQIQAEPTKIEWQVSKELVCESKEVVYESEFERISALIDEAAEIEGLDANLMKAVWIYETGWGTSKAFVEYHNFGGLTGANGLYQYETEPQGLEAFIKTIRWYSDNGMTTPEQMSKTYCPPNSESWAESVRKIMGDLNG